MTFEEFKTRAKQLSLLPEKVRYFIGAIVTTGDFQVNPPSVYPSCRAREVIFHMVLSFLSDAIVMADKRLAAAETMDEYLERLGHAPLLSFEEERELLSKAQHDDSEALQILKFANEPFIFSLVNAYRTPLNVTDPSSFLECVKNLVREMDQIILGCPTTGSVRLMGFLIGVLMRKYGLGSKIDRFKPVGEEWKEEAKQKLAEENILTTPALLTSLSDREKAITCMWCGIGCARHSVEDIAEIGLLTPERVQRIMDRIKRKLTE